MNRFSDTGSIPVISTVRMEVSALEAVRFLVLPFICTDFFFCLEEVRGTEDKRSAC